MTVNTTQLVSSDTSRREASSLLRGAIENQRKEARRSEAAPIEIAHYDALMGTVATVTQIFRRGMDAHNHPGFYRQLRQDPDQITTAALQLLARKFNLTPR